MPSSLIESLKKAAEYKSRLHNAVKREGAALVFSPKAKSWYLIVGSGNINDPYTASKKVDLLEIDALAKELGVKMD